MSNYLYRTLAPERHRLKLAEKQLSGKRLTRSEREDIYWYLTNNEAPTGKATGRPNTIQRDQAFAFDYLMEVRKGLKQPQEIRKELAQKHNIIGTNVPYEYKDNTASLALKRGMNGLYKIATKMIKTSTEETDSLEQDQTFKRLLSTSMTLVDLIDKYRDAYK